MDFKTMVYIQITRNNAWTSLDLVLPRHFKAHPENVSMFVSKKKIVVQPLVLIAVAIVAKPLRDSSLKLQTIVILWRGRSWIIPHTLVTNPVLQKESRSASVLF